MERPEPRRHYQSEMQKNCAGRRRSPALSRRNSANAPPAPELPKRWRNQNASHAGTQLRRTGKAMARDSVHLT